MMLPLNINLQLNATSALWANDSTLEILHKHILKYDQLLEGGVRLGLVVEGEDGRLGLALDDLSTTTHPLQ